MAFNKALGLLVDGYEKEILGLLKKLELRIKGKTVRQGTKKAKVSGSKLERELQKLEFLVNYKTDLRCGRKREKRGGGGGIFTGLVNEAPDYFVDC